MENKTARRLLPAACALLISAAGVQAAETTDVLKEMETANAADTLVEKYGKAAYRETFYYGDDTVSSEYRYKDASLYVCENDYGLTIDENGEVYGFDSENAAAFRYLFLDGAYEEFLTLGSNEYLSGYIYDEEQETLLSQEEKDGSLYVYSEITAEEITQEFAEIMDYPAEDVAKDLFVYQLDPETLVIQKITHIFQMTDGTENVLQEAVWVEDPEDYVPEEQLKEVVFAEEDVRTVTITVDPGTDQEQVYTQTIARQNGINLMLPADYDQTVYEDAECTVAYAGGADTNEDLNLYVKSGN